MSTTNLRRLTGASAAPLFLLLCVAALSPATAARAQARQEVDRNDESTRSIEPVRSNESNSSRSDDSSSNSSSNNSSNSSSNDSSSSSSKVDSSSINNDSSGGDRVGGDEGGRGRGSGRGDGGGRNRGDGDGRHRHRDNPGGGGAGTGGGEGRGGRHHGGRGDGDHRRGRRHDGDDKDHHKRRRHSRDDETIYQPTEIDNSASAQASDDRDECQRGYDQGLRTGASDARKGMTNDPYRSRHYKNGGGGFFSWGRSGADKQAYRDCFLRGYEEGYRNP